MAAACRYRPLARSLLLGKKAPFSVANSTLNLNHPELIPATRPQSRAFSAKKENASSYNPRMGPPDPTDDQSASSDPPSFSVPDFVQQDDAGFGDNRRGGQGASSGAGLQKSFKGFMQSEDKEFGGETRTADRGASKQEFSFDFLQEDRKFGETRSEAGFLREELPSKWSSDMSEDSDFLFGNTRRGGNLPGREPEAGHVWQKASGTGHRDSDAGDFSFKSIMQGSGELDLFSVRKPVERDAQKPDEEESIFDSPSFQVLRDSFFDNSRERTQGLHSSGAETDWLSLVGPSSKPSESVSLKELESSDFFTSSTRKAPVVKTYTYEELGERLRQLRPPLDPISNTLGLSFRELGERLQKIRKMEEDGPQHQRMETFQELKDSLQLLSNKSPDSNYLRQGSRPPSLQELALMNRMGTSDLTIPQITYLPPKDNLLEKYFSKEQMCSKDLLKLEITKLINEFQVHEADTGTPQVQIAILTAKINNLYRHFRENHNSKRDKHSKRGFNGMIQDRKRLLWYLRRRDWDAYCNVLTKLRLADIIHEKLGSRYK